jgi:hypothetical protein
MAFTPIGKSQWPGQPVPEKLNLYRAVRTEVILRLGPALRAGDPWAILWCTLAVLEAKHPFELALAEVV